MEYSCYFRKIRLGCRMENGPEEDRNRSKVQRLMHIGQMDDFNWIWFAITIYRIFSRFMRKIVLKLSFLAIPL